MYIGVRPALYHSIAAATVAMRIYRP